MRTASLCVVVIALAQLGATDCNGGIIRDPGYDIWCGDSLCAWKVARGQIGRVPTWHDADPGVMLIERGTTIEQFTPVTSRDGTCIRFDLISNVEESAQVELDVDVYGDGTIERSFALPTTTWKPVSYRFSVEPPFTGIRFAFTMRGYGLPVLARMHAQVLESVDCDGIEPIRGGPAPLGTICATGGDCASRICVEDPIFGPACAGCDPMAPACAGGQVCGLDDPGPAERRVALACVDAGARVLGEGCVGDAECASGVCALNSCSICRVNADCGGALCGFSYPHGPQLCHPRERMGERGQPCSVEEDCASGTCLGAPSLQCFDGRSCASDSNCPVDIYLIPGTCSLAGVQGGTCA